MLNEYEIKQVHNTKFLEVRIDEHLTWKNHINYVTCKIAKTVGILCKAHHYFYREGFIIKSDKLLIDVPSPYLW